MNTGTFFESEAVKLSGPDLFISDMTYLREGIKEGTREGPHSSSVPGVH